MKRLPTRLLALVLAITILAGFALPSAQATELKTGIGVVMAS